MQQPSSTTSTGSTGSNDTIDSFNDRREEPLLDPDLSRMNRWDITINGLRARSSILTDDSVLPQVEANLNEPTREEDLEVAVEYIEV